MIVCCSCLRLVLFGVVVVDFFVCGSVDVEVCCLVLLLRVVKCVVVCC